MSERFEFLEHTADIKMRAYGDTIEDLFCNALVGMFKAIGPSSSACRIKNNEFICDNLPEKRIIQVTARSQDLLLVDFLSEALCLSDIHNEAYLDATIHEITDMSVKATVYGIVVDCFETEIKAVTYHELELKQIDGKWQAIIVFDI